MELAVDIAGYINNALFIALAGLASYQWWRQRDAALGWFAATFLVLALIVTASLFLPDEPTSTAMEWVFKVELAILVLFPYFLHRFMGTFVPRPQWVKVMAISLTAVVIAWTFTLPRFPGEGEALSTPLRLWLSAFMVQWGVLSLMVTARLWVAGRGQPSVARIRMRLLSAGSFGLTAVILLAGAASSQMESESLELISAAITTVSVLAFFFGFAPPGWLRVIWRRPESEALQRALSGLMASRSTEGVATRLLPHVVSILGARGAALLAPDGDVIAAEGLSEEMLQELVNAAPTEVADETHTTRFLVLPFEFGRLVVWASPYTPFFGREEVGLVTSLGALTDVAMERVALFHSVERAKKEIEDAHTETARREAMLAQAQEISGIGSWEWDVTTGKLDWSDQMYRIHGVDPGTYMPSFDSYSQFVHPEDREYSTEIVESAIARGERFKYESRIVQPSGDIRIVEASGQVDNSNGAAQLRVFGVLHDITDRKETEKAIADAFSRERLSRVSAERANQELESFVYSVSHDLNSPLISVLGYVDLLEGDYARSLPEEARFYLERIKASSSYIQSLIQDLLELSRVGRVQTEPDDVDVGRLVADIADEIRSSHPEVEIDVAGGVPDIYMNALRARQLFANLLQNAVKYARRPDVRIRVSAEPGANGHVTVSVHDNGPGIPPEARDRVFGVFERLETEVAGTGMGLAVCKRIVETSGGQIWIADSESGTDVRLDIPATAVRTSGGTD